jgi:hypothetical protein
MSLKKTETSGLKFWETTTPSQCPVSNRADRKKDENFELNRISVKSTKSPKLIPFSSLYRLIRNYWQFMPEKETTLFAFISNLVHTRSLRLECRMRKRDLSMHRLPTWQRALKEDLITASATDNQWRERTKASSFEGRLTFSNFV